MSEGLPQHEAQTMIAQAPKQYGSESCHAYDSDGNPHHSVPYKDKKRAGEMRPTTLRDIKENRWYPSVSQILSVQAKPGLAFWIKEQVAKAACELDWTAAEGGFTTADSEALVPLILLKAEENMTRARDLGTEIHGAIERYLRDLNETEDCMAYERLFALSGEGHSPFVKAAVDALKELGVWGQPFEAERTFASVLGYGGTIDFRANWIFADFKCVDSLEKKLAYPDRCAQLCAYAMGAWWTEQSFGSPDWSKFRLANIFISTSEPGKYLIHEWSQEDKEQGWKLFMACFQLWKVANNYDPSHIAPSPGAP